MLTNHMEAYNITRPLSVMLEAGELQPPYNGDWQDPMTGEDMGFRDRMLTISRVYERNGFIRLIPLDPRDILPNNVMGRRIDPADHPAAPGDMAIVPPNPPDTDLFTPSPVRRRRRGHEGPKYGRPRIRSRTPDSPSLGRGGGRGGDNDNDNDNNENQ